MRDVIPSRWDQVILVCGKCSKKVGGGFGKDGDVPLAKALRRHLDLGRGRKAAAGIVEVRCLGLCPKQAVVAIDAARPGAWRLVAPGSDLDVVAESLGLMDR